MHCEIFCFTKITEDRESWDGIGRQTYFCGFWALFWEKPLDEFIFEKLMELLAFKGALDYKNGFELFCLKRYCVFEMRTMWVARQRR